jgi:hypothetical protein
VCYIFKPPEKNEINMAVKLELPAQQYPAIFHAEKKKNNWNVTKFLKKVNGFRPNSRLSQRWL